MGRALADDQSSPHVFAVNVGPFRYLAGDGSDPAAGDLLSAVPAHSILMPSPAAWIALAERAFGDRLEGFPRSSYQTEHLSVAQLVGLVDASRWRDRVTPLDEGLVASLLGRDEGYFDIEGFDSPADFVERGIGFGVVDGESFVGAAWSSLVCSRGIEVSVVVDERHRRRGVATAVAGRLVLACLTQGIRPNWDAADSESCRLAEKLGFVRSGQYHAYYLRP
jgi:GNAT superfamily N-acetyltransferase